MNTSKGTPRSSQIVSLIDNLTPREKNLLLYLETCAVDYGGKIDRRRINDDEIKALTNWHDCGFIQLGRIAARDIVGGMSLWSVLSEDAWKVAHDERKARHTRSMQMRKADYIGLEE